WIETELVPGAEMAIVAFDVGVARPAAQRVLRSARVWRQRHRFTFVLLRRLLFRRFLLRRLLLGRPLAFIRRLLALGGRRLPLPRIPPSHGGAPLPCPRR